MYQLTKYIVIITIFFLFINCSVVGIVSGSLIDRHLHTDELTDSLKLLKTGDIVQIDWLGADIKGKLITISENAIIVKQDSKPIEIKLRDIRSLNLYKKSYRWTGILLATGIVIDAYLAAILTGLGNMH